MHGETIKFILRCLSHLFGSIDLNTRSAEKPLCRPRVVEIAIRCFWVLREIPEHSEEKIS